MAIKIGSIYTKVIKMPSLKAWMQRTIDIIREEWAEAQVLKVR
jgi:hypothetical protein